MGKQVEVLEHHPYFEPDAMDMLVVAINAYAINAHVALLKLFEGVQTAKQGRFSGARGSDYTDNIAAINVEADIVNSGDITEPTG
jgi:hypothetical protein